MKRPLSGKKWFHAQGQRAQHLGQPWYLVKQKFDLYSLPKWAQQALASGHVQAMKNMKVGNV